MGAIGVAQVKSYDTDPRSIFTNSLDEPEYFLGLHLTVEQRPAQTDQVFDQHGGTPFPSTAATVPNPRLMRLAG